MTIPVQYEVETPDLRSDVDYTSNAIALGCGIGGLQFVWSLLQATLTPFLESLGFSKSACALAWGIGPVMGVFVQPIFGRWSDRYSHPVWDRRRPFMIAGGAVISISLLGLATSDTSARYVWSIASFGPEKAYSKTLAQSLAVFWLFFLHVGIQPLQVSSRAYIIENAGTGQQVLASAWAGRLQGICSILAFVLASMPLSQMLPWSNALSPLTLLCAVTDIILCAMITVACLARRGDTLLNNPDDWEKTALSSSHGPSGILRLLQTIPRSVRHIFLVQWFSWMAWFPFMAHYATYIDRLVASKIPRGVESQATLSPGKAVQQTPHSSALPSSHTGLLFSMVAFASTCILPFFVDCRPLPKWLRDRKLTISTVLTSLWGVTQAYFVMAILLLTLLTTSPTLATVLIASVGVSWAVSNWVPYSLLGMTFEDDVESVMINPLLPIMPDTGMVMGLHNIAISAPQILSALLSSLVPILLPYGWNSVSWTLCISGGWMAIAATLLFALL